jgi:hypothetical protein
MQISGNYIKYLRKNVNYYCKKTSYLPVIQDVIIEKRSLSQYLKKYEPTNQNPLLR